MADFFNLNLPINAEQVSEITGAELLVNKDKKGKNFFCTAPLDRATEDNISFLTNKKYLSSLSETQAGGLIIHPDLASQATQIDYLFLHKDPYFAYAKLLEYFFIPVKYSHYISPNAIISPNAVIGKNCYIGNFSVIEDNVVIGDNTFIDNNVTIKYACTIGTNCAIYSHSTIQYSEIGDNVIIHPGVQIGQDGFGFAFHAGAFYKVPQVGKVIIENDVEIGAATTIDRGSSQDTVIGQGTKIDNLVQIGHNVKTGKNCIIVAMTGIAGSTILGDYVTVGGQVGIAGHLKIGSKSTLLAKSGIHADVPEGATYGGSPALPAKDWHRQSIMLKNMIKRKNNNDGSDNG